MLQNIKEAVQKIAPMDASVLITGDNELGRELVLRWVHEMGNTKGDMIEIDSAFVLAYDIEQTLCNPMIEGMMLVLRDIHLMPPYEQSKVLRAIKSGKIKARIVAMTGVDLLNECKQSRFRKDLYDMIGVVIIDVPFESRRANDTDVLLEELFKEFKYFNDFRDYAERIFLEHKLIKNRWNVLKTCKDIGTDRGWMHEKISKYNLKRVKNKRI